jgi:hypothetical protein
VALGCTAAAGIVILLVVFVVFAGIYLDSGSDSGRLVLDDAEAYAPGSVEFISQRNFYLVRLGDGSYLALADLDAANRASQQRRCRVAPVPGDDAQLPALLEAYALRVSPAAAGSTLLFRESCNMAVYDVTGVRMDAEGPNLDRYPVDIRSDGKLTVDVSQRRCTRRAGSDPFGPIACP